ncbi:hypothetical protein SNOG_08759 [Parastagonospora nodorum SN15]|uniref:Uncharacterized protein n=1 Tax=Phaeosphaeria nodorum (strain SN15 / ATCC MYA-4574 / FGSC 10173) TaxID=321614 RepID=Q0UHK5_PHANO|nr:hypothetical protein SNOG_08759 [Parastagonospora nodorum SN15]EAT83927.1 hypothetical protein SNOG_08759 [Parastagonospora nodorum SN15]
MTTTVSTIPGDTGVQRIPIKNTDKIYQPYEDVR